VVELVRATGKAGGQVARALALTETAVGEWAKRADLEPAGQRRPHHRRARGAAPVAS
jgi:hypothetical protein